MSNSLIMRNWLLFGAGLGVYGAIYIFVATDGNFMGVLAGIAIGLAGGIVGGIVTVLSHKYDEPYSPDVEKRPKVLSTIGLILIVLASLVRAADGPAIVHLPLTGLSILIFFVASYLKKRSH